MQHENATYAVRMGNSSEIQSATHDLQNIEEQVVAVNMSVPERYFRSFVFPYTFMSLHF